MDVDDLDPRKPAKAPKNLEVMGIEELQEYIVALEAEIARVRTFIDAKRAQRGSAEALFKS